MCVSSGAADFTGAITVGIRVNDDTHLLGYQIAAKTLSGPNCMILHVPAAGDLSNIGIVDTSGVPLLLRRMGRHARSMYPRFRSGSTQLRYELREHGIFTVVLAHSAAGVREALEHVPEEKRPSISDELLDFYDVSYPEYKMVVFCFNNADMLLGQPLLLRYPPNDPGRIFAPGLDEHSGHAPILGATVMRNFKVVFGNNDPKTTGGSVTNFGAPLSDELHTLLSDTKYIGFRVEEPGPNGDYSIPVRVTTQSAEDQPYDCGLYRLAANISQ